MQQKIQIRVATEEDAEELLEIYIPYVEQTAITFEYEPPTLEEFTERIRSVKKKYPYIVAVEEGRILGYAYVSQFKGRPAYDWSVETSIYVRMDAKRGGIGSALYEALEDILKLQGILNANACIAYPAEDDAHLTMDSVYFHEKLGYKMVGKFHKSGYKYNTWYDMVWMEKMLGEHLAEQPAVKPFAEVEAFMNSNPTTYE